MEFDKAVSGRCLLSDSILYFIACDNIHVQVMPKQTVSVYKDYFSFYSHFHLQYCTQTLFNRSCT